jgi:hypothetical protein
MTITPVSSVNHGEVSLDEAHPPPVSIADPILALAQLLVETDYLRAELDRQNLQAARQAQSEALSRQVAALHDAADDVATGALIQGGLTALGAGMSAVSTVAAASAEDVNSVADARLLGQGGSALQAMAEPAGRVAGEAPRLHAEADAKQAEHEAQQAGFRVDDAREHQRRVADHSDRLLDAASGIIESEHAGNLAILANS